MGVCEDCDVDVPRLGFFCRDCALVRAGVRYRWRRVPVAA